MINKHIFKVMMAGILSAVILLSYLQPTNIVWAAPPEFTTVYRSDTFDDNIVRYFVPEVNSSEEDLQSIINDLLKYGIIFNFED